MVGVGTTTRVMKPDVSRLLSEIQHSSCTCSIGNEPQNTPLFFLKFDALHACTGCKLKNSVSPFVYSVFLKIFVDFPSIFFKIFLQILKLIHRQEENADKIKSIADEALNISNEAYTKAIEAINKQKNIR